ncbi:wall-associated receptor kinase 2-like [Carya illinoinensis]|nr:wall-associated receptor kinase 2-like [Carya illinoinensis]
MQPMSSSMSSSLQTVLLQQEVVVKLLLGALIISIATFVAATAKPNSSCNRICGSLEIPYPFGTSEDCYLDSSFLITCNSSSSSFNSETITHTPFLRLGNIKVLNISLVDGELRVLIPIVIDCPLESNYNSKNRGNKSWTKLREFPISYTKNVLIAVGCDTLGLITSSASSNNNYTTGCVSRCYSIKGMVNNSCSGIGCCQTPIPDGIKDFTVSVESLKNHSKVRKFNPCGFAFVVEEKEYKFSTLDLQNMQNKIAFPLVLDWTIGNKTCKVAKKNTTGYACKAANSECYNSTNGPGYRCNCSIGYYGNPYLSGGCIDIDECQARNHECAHNACVNHPGSYNCSCPKGYQGDGWRNGTSCVPDIPKPSNSKHIIIALCISISLLILLLGGSSVLLGLKRRKLIKLQEKYFQQNGGLMLQEHILNHGRSMETTKIFSNDELKKATNNYDESKVLGKGGYGTVYKGVLPDKKEVAIKKSKICDKSQIEQFINEVILLTQINHRNVVKLIGCCLETEVPLLVYEFITNGTLSDHIHDISRASSLSWEKRLKIATETARALAYLHSETSMPIIHRDVKSTNILLDDNHTAKVADFGASRLIALDQTEITTLVQGTLGYLDPEYFQTGQLTEKSDVYSFGVVLAELLTGEEAISTNRPETYKNLSMYFVSAVKEDRLFDILEDHIVNEGNIEPLKEVANIAKGCLRLRGEDRPTMMEVATELEGLRIMEKHPWEKDNQTIEGMEYLPDTPTLPFNIDNGASSSVSAVSGHDSMINQLLKPVDDGR